jgi:hypothetical protein
MSQVNGETYHFETPPTETLPSQWADLFRTLWSRLILDEQLFVVTTIGQMNGPNSISNSLDSLEKPPKEYENDDDFLRRFRQEQAARVYGYGMIAAAWTRRPEELETSVMEEAA